MTPEDLLIWITNDGLGMAVSAYLIYWMTNKLEKKLDEILAKLP